MLINLTGATKVFCRGTDHEVRALDQVDLGVEPAEMIAITGPSGSGKSTLLHVLSGLEGLTEGQYFFDGIDFSTLKDKDICKIRSERIAMIMQEFGLLTHEDILTNVCLPQIIRGIYGKKIKAKAREELQKVGLFGIEKKPVFQLSGGQKQRVAIARALTMDAEVILADEPTGALDSENTKELMNLFQKINEQGVTILIVTHDPLVAAACPKEYRIIDGKLSLVRSK
jgi:putative ABC transport system ATP-binding protein